jgi:hypothetical protein
MNSEDARLMMIAKRIAEGLFDDKTKHYLLSDAIRDYDLTEEESRKIILYIAAATFPEV